MATILKKSINELLPIETVRNPTIWFIVLLTFSVFLSYSIGLRENTAQVKEITYDNCQYLIIEKHEPIHKANCSNNFHNKNFHKNDDRRTQRFKRKTRNH